MREYLDKVEYIEVEGGRLYLVGSHPPVFVPQRDGAIRWIAEINELIVGLLTHQGNPSNDISAALDGIAEAIRGSQ